jgi:tRNA G46 methylase TrmB
VCYLENSGWGELCLLTALEHPDISFIAIELDEERRHVAQYAAEIAAPNLTYVDHIKDF